MTREELIKALKDWKPELELLAKYNDNSIDYQRYNVLDETIKTLEQIPDLKEAYNKGYKDGQEALAFHLELCKEEQEPCEDCIKIPEGATRGEVLKKVLKETFPDMICVWYRDSAHLHRSITFSEDWWNSPYRKEQE